MFRAVKLQKQICPEGGRVYTHIVYGPRPKNLAIGVMKDNYVWSTHNGEQCLENTFWHDNKLQVVIHCMNSNLKSCTHFYLLVLLSDIFNELFEDFAQYL